MGMAARWALAAVGGAELPESGGADELALVAAA
jgi:hypothetical protein